MSKRARRASQASCARPATLSSRGGDAHVHPPLAAGIELDVAGGAAGVDAAAAAPGPVETGRDVHAAGAVGQAAARIGVAVQRLRGGIQGQPTTRIDIVEQQVGVAVFGEIEAEQRRMVGRRDRGGAAVVEAHVVTVGARTLMAALERQRTLAAVGGRHAAVGRGHHLEPAGGSAHRSARSSGTASSAHRHRSPGSRS
ncbi:hypothetical protein G6F63_013780 [Rhizopus arrhizus]|nr:hypothetical protein G6F63_013780 [Rhizopus arrhizus]